ncbi:unnamed protein product [Cladocopium goreaui]|uniref:GPS domain-containing protein n=1 Tax=Cladocopium goreaui TaxID=2562237 RepID=A0A9P1BH22_9DINO|nr:unnamed protein product [Cladocopium goreaui]
MIGHRNRSSFSEQTTPAVQLIYDDSASVSRIAFQDFDLDLLELGGEVTWPAPSSSRVKDYILYFYTSGNERSEVGVVPHGSNAKVIPSDTTFGDFQLLAVYTRSTLAEQSTPVTAGFSDTYAAVENVTFPDFDLDATDLGGSLTWEEPSDASVITHYEVYIARTLADESPAAVALLCSANLQELQAVISGSWSMSLDGATAVQVETAARNSLLSSLSLAEEELITTVTFSSRRLADSADSRRLATVWTVTYSALLPVELADSALEQMRSFSQQPQSFQVLLASALQTLGVGTSSLQLQSFEAPMMQVVMKSDESQADNSSSDLSDAVPSLRRLSSVNDTDDSDVNSTVTLTTTWTMWAPVPNVTYGVGNMTRCGNGFYMTYIGTSLAGQPSFQVLPDFALANWTHFLVFSASSFAEASVPASHLIYDMAASVSDVRYDGLDLDPEELGGNVSWLPPNLTERVKVYRVYLAESAFPLSAAERYWISPEVEVGSSLVSVESWESGTGHSKQRPHCSGHRRWCWLDVGCREPKTG